MQSEFYPFQSDDSRLYFEFLSVSPKKTIEKAVVFTLIDSNTNLFNLALVDILSDGSHSDKTVSNNGDFEKIMATVAECVGVFFRVHPAARVHVQGSTPSRNRLYRIVFARELSKIKKNYELHGLIGSLTEPFEVNKDYNVYLLKLKKDESTH
ncbi:DUF6934 family protein [Dyadobacter endophyticus]|uniref:DUF6934 family protein n=1 Tax=Dyadobacter endophyticus TaxID=1749036 RepID=UPI003CEA7D4B